MPVEQIDRGSGVAFLVSSGIVYEIIAANCSSPQTTEINAKVRADTTMKWVYVGLVQAGAFVVIAAWIDRGHAKAILAGGALAAAIMFLSYTHGMAAGLSSTAPGTETWSQG